MSSGSNIESAEYRVRDCSGPKGLEVAAHCFAHDYIEPRRRCSIGVRGRRVSCPYDRAARLPDRLRKCRDGRHDRDRARTSQGLVGRNKAVLHIDDEQRHAGRVRDSMYCPVIHGVAFDRESPRCRSKVWWGLGHDCRQGSIMTFPCRPVACRRASKSTASVA